MIHALALETSSRVGSVALVLDGLVVGQQVFPSGLQHAARIVPAIDELCRSADWKSDSISEIYVSAGPGSFTGLRIGITLAKTLAWATGAKLVAVPTVNVLVENAPPEAKDVVIVIDAKRDQIFTASFSRSELGWSEHQPAHLDSLAEMLRRAPRPVHLLGEGIPFHQKFVDQSDAGIIFVNAEHWRPRAEIVAQLGCKMARAGQFIDPLNLIPIYIRKPEAEEKWEQGLLKPR
jgi:tRNA threonylcarbamoyladenosine biosynthesis protein TsaB